GEKLPVNTPLFEGMIVTQQDDDVADEGAASVVVDDVPAASNEPSIPSPTPTTQPPPPSQELPSTSQVQPTTPPSPIAQPPSPQQQPQPSQPAHDSEIPMDLFHTLWTTCTRRVKHLEQDKIAQTLEITKLKQRVKKLERRNKLKVFKLRRLKKVGAAQRVDTSEDIVMDDVSKQGATITVATTPITAATITIAPSAARRRKEVVIRDPKETATPSIMIHSEPKSKDKGKGIMVDEPKPLKKKDKEDNVVMKYQSLKRKPQTEAQAKKNMMIYLRNMARLKMDYFNGMSYDDICPIFEKYSNSNVAFLEKTKEQMEEEDIKALKRASESQAEKVAKKQKLDEEVKELKKHLQIVPNDVDDVFIEATPLDHKVPVVNYEIYIENNKPYYKIIRADGFPQLSLSFLSILRNFDKEDLEMFEKPDVQAQVWKNQRSVHGLEKDKQPSTNIQSTSTPSTHINVHAEENNNDQAGEREHIQDDEFTNPFCASAQEEADSSSHNLESAIASLMFFGSVVLTVSAYIHISGSIASCHLVCTGLDGFP
nr:hypothetical protein [Tanacetum cinerariifolium]